MRKLLLEYRQSRKELKKMLDNLGDSYHEIENDKPAINSMIDSVTKIIEWLETGRNPYYQQGIDVRYAYDVTRLSNMDILPDLQEQLEPEPLELTDKQRQIVIKIFRTLSNRERDCFILYTAKLMSMSEIANELGISKSTVQSYLDNAREKIEKVVASYEDRTN